MIFRKCEYCKKLNFTNEEACSKCGAYMGEADLSNKWNKLKLYYSVCFGILALWLFVTGIISLVHRNDEPEIKTSTETESDNSFAETTSEEEAEKADLKIELSKSANFMGLVFSLPSEWKVELKNNENNNGYAEAYYPSRNNKNRIEIFQTDVTIDGSDEGIIEEVKERLISSYGCETVETEKLQIDGHNAVKFVYEMVDSGLTVDMYQISSAETNYVVSMIYDNSDEESVSLSNQIAATFTVQNEAYDQAATFGGKYTSINDFTYNLDKNNKTVELVKYNGEDAHVAISPLYNIDGTDYRVTSISDNACFMGRIRVESIYIPYGVEKIGGTAFNSTTAKHIYIPSSAKFDSKLISYVHDYKLATDYAVNMLGGRDLNVYKEIHENISESEELGREMGNAANAFLAGLTEGASEEGNETVLCYGGTQEQWNSMVQ